MAQTVISKSDPAVEDDSPIPDIDASARADASSVENAPSEHVIADEASTDEASFRFVHSHGFAELLEAMGATSLVSTYQTTKLVAFPAREGRVSMSLRWYGKAMGLAVRPDQIAVASDFQIWTLRNSSKVLPSVHFPAVVGFNKNSIHRACVVAPEREIV